MKKLISAVIVFITVLASYAQPPENAENPKLIAVVNRANWCGVCKANGERFGNLLLPYSTQGLRVVVNDLTNDKTKQASLTELENMRISEAVNSSPRHGMGKMLKACGLVKDKKMTSDVAGIVTFIDPKTHKQLKQLSIAVSDEEMNKTITQLLK